MSLDATSQPEATRPMNLEEKVLASVIVYFVLLRVVLLFGAYPISDESYYWLWGRHFDLSYFDHPPLQGWLQGLSYLIFGRSLFALRWMTVAALAVVAAILWLVAGRVGGEARRVFFLRSLTVYLASPLFGFFGGVAFHDYLLVALVMSAGYLFVTTFTRVENGEAGWSGRLFGAAVLLGLAGLTKYNAIFLGLAVIGAVGARPGLRRLLLDWRLYAAGAIAIALQAPVILWNLQHDFASFGFQLGSRHGEAGFTGINVGGMKAFVGEALLMVSPFFVPVIIMFFWAQQRQVFERVGKTLAIWTFWISSLACLYVANYSWVIWWWNIVAYVLIFPFAGRYARGWLLGLHIAWGALLATILTVNFAVVPIQALIGAKPGMETERSYDLDRLVDAVRAAKQAHGAGFVASNHYIAASQLAFLLDDPDIVELSERQAAFDDWFDPATRRGQSAIIVEEPNTDTQYWRQFFADITDLGEVEARRFGYLINTYRLYLGTGFAPLDAPAAGS